MEEESKHVSQSAEEEVRVDYLIFRLLQKREMKREARNKVTNVRKKPF